MLQVTLKAADHLIDVRRKRGVDEKAGARFIRNGGGVGLTFATTPQDGDRVIKGEQIDVYVAPEIADVMDRSIIDARDQDGQTSLILRRPQKAKPNSGSLS